MPRSSREQASRHREAIETASARLFRERGLNGISVADLMASAGLTHGGFYGHFASKDALAGIACTRAFAESRQRWADRIAAADGDRKAMRANLVEPYLRASHRDHPGLGCPAAALAGDVGREPSDKPVSAAFVAGLRGMLDDWQKTLPVDENEADPEGGAAIREQQALAELSMMVGAMMLSRATRGDPLSESILAAARAALTGPEPED